MSSPAAIDDASKAPQREAPAALASNAIRLSPREWIVAAVIAAALAAFIPDGWRRIEPFQAGRDYRIPYSLGEDYWLYSRYCDEACSQEGVVVLGDSVVWGHYVGPTETLSHDLAKLDGRSSYANLGVDGIHPAAMAGLVESYGQAIRDKDVILFCNPLWMSSPKHDLQEEKESAFNHPRLVGQFSPWIPCYKEPLDGRLGIVVQRVTPLLGWVSHLRIAYFANDDFVAWTLEHPYENPADAVSLELPPPDEPPSPEPVAEPWTAKRIERYSPPWVALATSIQWQSFQRTVRTLQDRGNRVFVLVGPFNEHMLKPESLATYIRVKVGIMYWLVMHKIPYYAPRPLPSELYADASHPLAAGYALLARRLWESPEFVEFRKGD